MDHSNILSHPRDRHPRAPSRASISTASTRQTSHTHSSANTSLSAASPKLPPSSLPHRPYTTTGTKAPLAPLDTHSPISSFLQEKLQRERRFDLDARSAAPAPDPRNSPARPPSSGSADSRRKGMGVKEMEQTVSTLHKQNFDLKLELYHRRERQTALEDRLESLHREKAQVEDMNDTLVTELEKRDKAVEEAVAMIVLLESRVETLLREREMVRQVEAQGGAFRRLQYDEAERAETPRPRAPSVGGTDASTRAIHRVPSFVSARSDTTENLRSVYLGTHGSLHSLRRPEEAHDRSSVASPSLSVLSESSFLSVYGRSGPRGEADGRQSIDESLSEMRMAHPRLAQLEVQQTRSNSLSGTRMAHPKLAQLEAQQQRSNSLTSAPQAPRAPASNTNANAGANTNAEYTSPLQRLERTFSLNTRSSGASGAETPEARAEPSPSHQRTKEQKREALRRVMTDAPRRDHGLPPTPDTISTTTLRRCKNSDDTLEKAPREGARLDLPPLLQGAPAPDKAQLPSVTPVGTRHNPPSFFGNVPVTRRRSAGETTASRPEWDSDSDSDAASDIWMEDDEGAKTGRADSPDLFGFPPSMATWGGSAKPPDMDELISVQAGLLPASGPPPPPNRRSSLHAPTGDGAAAAQPRRRGHARRNSDGLAETHYPPAAQKPRGLGRLNPFRRSLGGSDPAEASALGRPASVMGAPSRVSAPGRSVSAMGVPSRVRTDDEAARATPPPILRSRNPGASMDDDGGVALAAPDMPVPTPPRDDARAEGRRKWLGGFRRDSRRAV